MPEMPERGPATDFEVAWNQLALTLREPRNFTAFYVEREHKRVDELIQALRIADQPLKVLYTGYPRTGKTTELFRLMSALEDRFVPVYFSVDESLERTDLEGIDLLLGMCMAVIETGERHGLEVDRTIAAAVGGWIEQVEGDVEQVASQQRTSGVEASAGLSSLVATFMARFQMEYETRKQVRKTLQPRSREIVDVINQLAASYIGELGKPPLLIADDLEKADAEDAQGVFVGRTASMLSVGCDVVYTIPISLVNAPAMQSTKRAFDRVEVLPMVAVTDTQGDADPHGVAHVAATVTKRAAESLFEGEALEQIALNSGGVIAEALGLARNCCLTAMTEGAQTVTQEMVAEHVEELVLSYKRGLAEKYYDKLRVVALEHSSEVDEDHGELMDALAILEYENNPNWYDVHPAVRRLLELRGEI